LQFPTGRRTIADKYVARFLPSIGWALVALVAALSIFALAPTPAVSASAPPTEFSSERALAHVRRIAREPHPMGSPAADDVREYVAQTFTELGLEVRVIEARSAVRVAGHVSSGRVRNVIARLPGTEGGKAVAVSAHYDSVPSSHGASDDGSGIATLLETARALKARGPRPRDVLFIATDGEEVAVLGAQALASDPEFVAKIGVLLNFDARGSRGAVAMFDPAESSGELIRLLGENAERPVASSFLTALAKTLPNDGDLTPFKRAGVPALGFAYADGFENYHRNSDDAEHIDPASLQHEGTYALALGDALGHRDLDSVKAPDVAYFDIFARTLIRYPLWAARLFALLTLVGFGALVRRALRKKLLTVRGVLGGAGIFLLTIALAGGVGFAMQRVFGRSLDFHCLLAFVKVTASATILVSAAVMMTIYGLALRRVTDANLTFGVFSGWALALAVAAVMAPALTPQLEWSLAFALIGNAGAMFYRRSWGIPVGRLAAAALFSPIVYSVVIATGATMLAAPAIFAVFGLGLLVPLFADRRVRRVLAGSALVVGVGLGVSAIRATPYRDEPKTDSLVYAIDTDAGKACFFTYDSDTTNWLGELMNGARSRPLPAFSRWPNAWFFAIDAALEPHAASEVSVLDDETTGDVRRLRLRITTEPGTRCVDLWDTEHMVNRGTAVDGAPIRDLYRFSPERDEELLRWMTGDTRPRAFHMRECAPQNGAFELNLEAQGGAPINLRIIAERSGLPAMVKPRGRSIPSESSDVTLVSRLATF
jgi:hypothetical protein